MLHRLTCLTACVALTVTPVTRAHADAPRDWYILNFGTGECVQARQAIPDAPNPEAFHHALRHEGVAGEVHVDKTEDGTLNFVSIETTRQGQTTTLIWFPSSAGCEQGRAGAKAHGLIPDDNDLK